MPSGSTDAGWLVVTNSTGAAINLTERDRGCQPKLGFTLVNNDLAPQGSAGGAFTADCSGAPFIIKPGVNRFPTGVFAIYAGCGGTAAPGFMQPVPCPANGSVAGLPAGRYTTALAGLTQFVPLPPSLAVSVVEAA